MAQQAQGRVGRSLDDGDADAKAAALREDGRLAELLAGDPGLARAWSADGFTALHYAAFFGGEAVARLLSIGVERIEPRDAYLAALAAMATGAAVEIYEERRLG